MSRDRQDGFTLIETIIAVTLILFAIVVTVQTLDSSRNLTDKSEKKSVAAKVGEQEIERLLALPYDQLAVSAAPAADGSVPLSFVMQPSGSCVPPTQVQDLGPLHEFNGCCPAASGNPPCYKWYQSGTATPQLWDEPIVVKTTAPNAGVAGPVTWTDSHLKGKLYRIITWVNDAADDATTHSTQDYKRITVAVTVDAGKGPITQPVLVTSMATDPNS